MFVCYDEKADSGADDDDDDVQKMNRQHHRKEVQGIEDGKSVCLFARK
jgi:hypothetical protein